jgi:poly(A) polymerase Pap1
MQDDFLMESALNSHGEVTELYPVPDSHVPVMKFKFNGISIDLVYAWLSL